MGNSPSKNDALPNTSSSSSQSLNQSSTTSSGTAELEPDESAPALSHSINYIHSSSNRHQRDDNDSKDKNNQNVNDNNKINTIRGLNRIPTNHQSFSDNYNTPDYSHVSSIANPHSPSNIKVSSTSTSTKKKSYPPSSSPRKINTKNDNQKVYNSFDHDRDLDLEISASMAKLLNNNSSNSDSSYRRRYSDESKFLNVPGNVNNEYGSSFESEQSCSSSPVFTTNEAKDEDSLLSLGSASSPTVTLNGCIASTLGASAISKSSDFDMNDPFNNLEPIVERSLESTPEPKRSSISQSSKSKLRSFGDSLVKSKAINKSSIIGSQLVKNTSSTSSSSSLSSPVLSSGTGNKKSDIELDSIIDKLLEVGMKKNLTTRRSKDKLPLTTQELKYILSKSRSIFLDQPTLLRLSPPVKVVGDLHGQFYDLIRIFNSCGYPPYTNYLFLGDYVDRGYKSLETILLLLCYKIKYPENFFMLRGNHESANITKIYGFYDECKRRLPLISGSHKLWKNFIDVFNSLPIAATINDKIFCIHGGLSPELQDLKQIENIKRPTDIPDKGLLADLLWSDPDPHIKNFTISNWPKNDRGVSYCFGKKHVDYFLQKFKMDLVVRGHMVVEDGYEFFNKRKFVTIFSAPNYCGEFNNYGAIMSVDKSLCCSFELLKPQ